MLSILLCVCAAPVPPPPKALCKEGMVGLWDYRYGSQLNGLMWLQDNGIYFSRHSPEADMYYWGLWWVEDNALCLMEYSYYPNADGRKWGSACNRYRFSFDLSKLPCYTGRNNYGSEVGLSNRREAEWEWLPPLWDTDN